MGRNWAITIGINHYDNLQELVCAQRDAEAMRDFFRDELGFEQIYHFTADSPPIEQGHGLPIVSRPTYATLMRFLRVRFEESFLRAGDNLWFFFAGHGLSHAERDYLMPLDADPGDVERTAISISYVTERLRRCGADNVVLLIDACRSLSRSGTGIGGETQRGVVTLFSCSPRERSYEIEEPPIQHGVFTYALLQGLRLQGESNCATVERLSQYLRSQVPELSRRYQKPAQIPYEVVEPASKYHLILLPRSATVRDAETLKLAAFRAEQAKDLDLAEQLWIRVWAVSPSDPDALEGVRRVDRLRAAPQPESVPPPEPPSRSRAQQLAPAVTPTSEPVLSPPSPTVPLVSKHLVKPPQRTTTETGTSQSPTQLSRRRLFRLIALGGVGAGGASLLTPLLLNQHSSKLTTSSKPSPSLEPVEKSLGEYQPSPPPEPVEKSAGVYHEDLGRGVLLDMVGIPKGSFTMGSPASEKEREKSEEPQHLVTFKQAFLMGKYQVTQVQWRAVAALPKIKTDLKPDPSRFKGDRRPVEQVSWEDAIEFCARLSKKTGREYRLPSEAEWEYACRAGTTTPFHFGETITTELANYRGTDWEYKGRTYPGNYGQGPHGSYRQETTEVGSFPANAFGLYDMHGNVWEWILDYWHENYKNAPDDGSTWMLGGDASQRVVRGGAWFRPPGFCRSDTRYYRPSNNLDTAIGFRVVCTSELTL